MPTYGYGKWDQAPYSKFDRLEHYSDKELENFYLRSKIECNFETAKYTKTMNGMILLSE